MGNCECSSETPKQPQRSNTELKPRRSASSRSTSHSTKSSRHASRHGSKSQQNPKARHKHQKHRSRKGSKRSKDSKRSSPNASIHSRSDILDDVPSSQSKSSDPEIDAIMASAHATTPDDPNNPNNPSSSKTHNTESNITTSANKAQTTGASEAGAAVLTPLVEDTDQTEKQEKLDKMDESGQGAITPVTPNAPDMLDADTAVAAQDFIENIVADEEDNGGASGSSGGSGGSGGSGASGAEDNKAVFVYTNDADEYNNGNETPHEMSRRYTIDDNLENIENLENIGSGGSASNVVETKTDLEDSKTELGQDGMLGKTAEGGNNSVSSIRVHDFGLGAAMNSSFEAKLMALDFDHLESLNEKLQKKSGNMIGEWHYRWVCVRKHYMLWTNVAQGKKLLIKDVFDAKEREKWRNCVNLTQVADVRVHGKKQKKFDVFMLNQKKVFHFKTDSKEVCQKWVQGLQERLKMLPRPE